MYYLNRVKFTTATTGTGTLTVGSASAGFRTPAQAGAVDGRVYRYKIEDTGNAWEIGYGTYTVSGTTLTRTVLQSSNSDNALDLSGSAVVAFVAVAEDIIDPATKIVTAEASSTLSAEVVIPGLAGSADLAGSAGGGVAYEFDSGASPLTWSAAVDTENVNSTVLSHLYVQDDGASETNGTYSWSPAGAFDIRCKLSLGVEIGTSAAISGCALTVGDSSMDNRVLVNFTFNGSANAFEITMYTYAGSFTQRGDVNTARGNEIYLRIVRDGSNNNSGYYSVDGITWILIATQSFTFTAAKAGLRLAPASVTATAAVDWIRSNV